LKKPVHLDGLFLFIVRGIPWKSLPDCVIFVANQNPMKQITRNFSINSIAVLLLSVILTACSQEKTSDLTKANLIPKPVLIESAGGFFTLTEHTNIYIQDENQELLRIGQYLSDKLSPATGFNPKVLSSGKKPKSDYIFQYVV